MWLDELRKIKNMSGLTTKEISIRAGLPEPTLEKIFSGATRDPKLTTIQQLVHSLGATLDDLTPEHKNSPTAEPQGINKNEAELIKLYRQCSPENQKILHLVAENFVLATTAKCQVEEDEQAEVARILDEHASSQSNSEEAGA